MSEVTVTLTDEQQRALVHFISLAVKAGVGRAMLYCHGAEACHDLSMAMARFSKARGEDSLRSGAITASWDQWLAARQEEAA